jgi:hypothetical protein
VKAGVAAEALASVAIGLALLLAFRHQDFSIVSETFGAKSLSGGSSAAALLAALAVGGWVFVGFDACGASRRRHAIPPDTSRGPSGLQCSAWARS